MDANGGEEKNFLINLVTCPVCLTVPDREKSECLFMCVNGHFACGPCGAALIGQGLDGMAKCPVCRTTYTFFVRSPHYIMSSLLAEASKGYQFVCDNEGCSHKAVGEANIAHHKSVCLGKRFRCPKEGCKEAIDQSKVYTNDFVQTHPCYELISEPVMPLDEDAGVKSWETVVDLWGLWDFETGRVTDLSHERPRVLRDPLDDEFHGYLGFRKQGLGAGLTIFLGWLDRFWTEASDPNRKYGFKLSVASMFPDGMHDMEVYQPAFHCDESDGLVVGNSGVCRDGSGEVEAKPTAENLDGQKALYIVAFVGAKSYDKAAKVACDLGLQDKRIEKEVLVRLKERFDHKCPFVYKRYSTSCKSPNSRKLSLDFDTKIDASIGIPGSRNAMAFFFRTVPLRYLFFSYPNLGDSRKAKVQFGNIEYRKAKLVKAVPPPAAGFELNTSGTYLSENGLTISREIIRMIIKKYYTRTLTCTQCDNRLPHLHIILFSEKKNKL